MKRLNMIVQGMMSLAAAVAIYVMPVAAQAATETAVFAGGCFWCVESDFDHVPGVLKTTSGYAGGIEKNPSYETVSAGQTGHAEAVQVSYDNSKVTYSQLVEYFWKTIDPTVKDRQFCDGGHQYRTALLYSNDEQKAIAEKSKAALVASKKFAQIYTEVAPVIAFYPAEEYHQDYYKKNPIRYNYYRSRCGRDARIEELWGKK